MGERAPFKRGRQAELLQYIIEQNGRHVTIGELEKKFKQYDRERIMSSLANVTGRSARYGYPITRVTQGVWKFDADKDPANDSRSEALPPQPTGRPLAEPSVKEDLHDRYSGRDMTVEILKERPTYLLVQDVVDEKVYKMTLVG